MGRFSRGKGGRVLCSRAAKLSARSLDRRQSLAKSFSDAARLEDMLTNRTYRIYKFPSFSS
jgi:hypothetical protein